MMNKILFITVVALVAFSSCKKDRTCTCITTVGLQGLDPIGSDTIINGTRAKAQDECSSLGKDEGLASTTCRLLLN